MKALSIKQPWAWLILFGGKPVENRTWNTHFRGEFLIHASKGCTKAEYQSVVLFARQAGFKGSIPPLENLPRGCFVGKVRLNNCTKQHYSPWHLEEQFGFYLQNPRAFEPIYYKGKLGFFDVPKDILQKINTP